MNTKQPTSAHQNHQTQATNLANPPTHQATQSVEHQATWPGVLPIALIWEYILETYFLKDISAADNQQFKFKITFSDECIQEKYF